MKKFWNLVILVLAASLIYQLYQEGKFNNLRQSVMTLMMPTNRRLGPEPTTTVVPSGTPVFASDSQSSPASEPESTGTPSTTTTSDSTSDTPSTQPVVFSSSRETSTPATTATSQPEDVDLARLDRRYWPRMVKLLKAVEFPIVINGKEAGKAAAPAGVMVRLLDIKGANLSVAMATSEAAATVAAADTDIEERVREIMKVVSSASTTTAPATISSPSNSSTSPFEPKLNQRGKTPFQRH